MEKINLNEYLASNEYPGRGIAVAMAPDGRQMFIGYFIMGRSENSRNRVFDPVPERGGICTVAADPAKLEDPSLIIYNPVLTLGKTHIVTNGDQTDTIYDLMSQGKSFADALRTRTFEPDGPNYTPRISAVVYADGSYQMSILKSADGNGDSVQRYFFDYPQPVAGEGHFISTYKHNGNPIPSFEGEPLRFACPRTIGDFAHGLWQNLNLDNKVSLFARVIDLDTVMPGLAVNDFGDSIRFGASTGAEDEPDLSRIWCDLELYELYVKGFIEGCGGALTDIELDNLPTGAMMMTFECGMRFLTDYLEGDHYFKTARENHNLERARTQFKLVKDMEEKLPKMKEIVNKYR